MSTNNTTWTRIRTVTVLNHNTAGRLLIHQEWRSNGTNSFTVRLVMEVNISINQSHASGNARMIINGQEFSTGNRGWQFGPGSHQILSVTRNLSQVGGDPSRVPLGRFSWRGTNGSSFGWGPTVATGQWFNSPTAVVNVWMGNPSAVGGSLSASPTTIIAGQSTTLSWSTSNATSISINQGVGSVAIGSGSRSVRINNPGSIVFTATISGAGGTITRSVTVTVNPAVPVDAMRWTNDVGGAPIQVGTAASDTWRWP